MVGRISSPVFVGRVEELQALEQMLAQLAAGSGGALLVTGDAGIGKSRLVSELEQRALARNFTVLLGECVELAEGELAFAPVISALRKVIELPATLEGLEPQLRSALAPLWPALGVEGEDSTGGREQLFEAVYRVLARLASDQPVVLIIEDVHWIDRSSRDLLSFLIRNARHNRLALVVTYRPDELHRGHALRSFITELERSGRAGRVELQPLRRSEIADQLAAIAGSARDADDIERIFSRCEGNPFFAEELLASAGLGGGALPASLHEALLVRFERMSDSTRRMLRVAAIVGRSVDHRLLVDVVNVDEPELLAALREAIDHHLLLASPDGSAYVFRHALLREAIYDDTLVGERLALHRAIAGLLSTHPQYASEGGAAELAYHWRAAGEDSAALAASVEAVREAAAMRAYGEAIDHLDRALELWDRVSSPDRVAGCDHFELLLLGSQLADWAGDAARALALAEQARAQVDERVEPLHASLAELRIGRAMHYAGRGAEAVEHYASARRLVPVQPPSLAYAEALSGEGRAMMLNDRPREARERLEAAISLTERLGARALQASSLSSLAIVRAELGERDGAVTAARQGLEIARQADSAESIMRGYINGSQAIDDAGRLEEALAVGIEGIAAAERLGVSRSSGDQLRIQAAWRLQRIGRLADAERTLQPALENATTAFNVGASRVIGGRIAVERGELDRSQDLLESAWTLVQGSGGFQLIGPASAARVLLALRNGAFELAQQRAREGVKRAAAAQGNLMYNSELFWLAVRVEAELAHRARASGDVDAVRRCEQAAAAVVDVLHDKLGTVPGDGAPPEAGAFHALAEAELTRVRDDPEPGSWRVAAQRFNAIGAKFPAVYAELRAAEALVVTGAGSAAIAETLEAVHAAAVEIGSQPFTDEVVALARRAGVTLDAPQHEPAAPVERAEPRVADVVELLTGSRRGPRPERLLATIVFTDIVGSTELATELGDKDWRALLDRHDELVRTHLKRYGGVVVKFIGDGTLTTFDGPGRAIEFACALRDAVKALGIEVRGGIHTGEIELRGDDIGGIAVHIAARVVGLAAPSEILVSQTVTDVVAGSGIEFEARGTHTLKGLPGSWQLSAPAPTATRR